LYLLFLKLIPGTKGQNPYLSIPFITTLLFLVHPIHTEVVANIKGRDEIFALLGSLYACFLTLRFLETKQRKYLIYSGIVFFLGLLSKENTITFFAIIPLTAYVFTEHKLRKILISLVPLGIATVIFLAIRQAVIGGAAMEIEKELLNNPFLDATTGERFATVFYTLGLYLKLLVFPHPLTFDYYPYHIPLMSWGDWEVLLSLIANAALLVFAVIAIRNKNKIAYGIWFYLLPLSIVSNLLFPVGVFMNERFIYISSIGFCFVIAYLLIEKLKPKISNPESFKKLVYIGLGVIVLLFSVKTIARNSAWKDNETLFSTDIETSSNSIKSNAGLGEILYHKGEEITNQTEQKKLLEQSIRYFQKSISIHPKYVNAMLLLANAWFEYDRSVDSTLHYYLRIAELKPNMYDVYRNLSVVISSLKNTDKELDYFFKFLEVNPERSDVNHQIGLLYGKEKNDIPNAIKYLKRASELKPEDIDILNDLGMAYGMVKEYHNAVNVFLSALRYKPNNKQIYINIGL
ncbi:MAG: glycosyltransferase family 39 protein, partial [Bacteroidota bacterium]|nr:glycosyltransferase family 39 protein [Bacteroidota bacterium]